MRRWGRFEAKGYINNLTLSICYRFFCIASLKSSYRIQTLQLNSNQSKPSYRFKSSSRNTYLWAGLPSPRSSTRMLQAR
jgi:hypothetical protein